MRRHDSPVVRSLREARRPERSERSRAAPSRSGGAGSGGGALMFGGVTTVPDGFLWGTATSAHQVEGGNYNSDWWAWEHDPASPCAEPSGDACDHYHRYPEDVAGLAGLGFNSYRFSIEWARIEPEEAEFSRAQLDHYARMCAACREQGLLPVVTFHHFTSPRWIATRGGWEEPSTADRFARFCDYSAAGLGDLIGVACTINEPNVVALHGYLTGLFAPGRRDPDARKRATETFIRAHHLGKHAIRSHAGAPVGLTLAMSEYVSVDGGGEALEARRAEYEDIFLEATEGDDFVGVQTYTRERIGPDGPLAPEPGAETTLMGYEFRPEALEATVRRAAEVAQASYLIVTENGVAVADDGRRIEFVTRALRGLGRCLEGGIDVRGFFYWSAFDNFEWAFGYRPTFGLIAVDRETQERTAKPSAPWLGEVARSGRLP